VGEGDSYALIAEKFDTSEPVIKTCNPLIPGAELWPGTPLVILPGRMDAGGLPEYEVFYLDQAVGVMDLSQQTGVEPEQLRAINGFGPEETVPAGRWVIYPRREGS
jgi:hypothetical protein